MRHPSYVTLGGRPEVAVEALLAIYEGEGAMLRFLRGHFGVHADRATHTMAMGRKRISRHYWLAFLALLVAEKTMGVQQWPRKLP